MENLASSATDIADITTDFDSLDLEETVSYEKTAEEVWLLSGLESIRELGEWLKGVWKAVTVREVDFTTLGYGKLQSPDLQTPVREYADWRQ